MSLTLPVLRSWQPTALAAHGGEVAAAAAALDDQRGAMARAADTAADHWTGDTATAAQGRIASLGQSGGRTSTGLVGLADVLTNAAADLDAQRTAVLSAVDTARAGGFVVADDGRVTAPTVPDGPDQPRQQTAVNSQAADHAETIGRLLAAADAADARWARDLGTAVDAVCETAAQRGLPPSGVSPAVQAILDGRAQLPSDPAALNAFWEGLTPEEKDALYAHDHSIGNHPGIPTIDRDHYNQRHITELQATAQGTLDAVVAQHPDWVDHPPPAIGSPAGVHDNPLYTIWKSQYDAAKTDLQGYQSVASAVGDGPTGQPPRYLMGIDSHDRAIIATGNPDTARNVATFVPGTGSTLSKIGGDVDRGDRMRAAAARAGDPNAAVITWYGYDAPPGLTDATDEKYADAGAGDLDNFQQGLRATHDGPQSHNTVIGHSYGTTLVGTAATDEHRLAADDVVLVASPGAMADHASDFQLDGVPADDVGQHVWATKAQYDPVPLYTTTGDFGRDPTGLDYGGQRFESASGGAGPWYELGWNPSAHSSYWDQGNPALANMGRIIAGEPGAVTR